jgi:hypothetical protein
MVAQEAEQLISALHQAVTDAIDRVVAQRHPAPPPAPANQITFEGMTTFLYKNINLHL